MFLPQQFANALWFGLVQKCMENESPPRRGRTSLFETLFLKWLVGLPYDSERVIPASPCHCPTDRGQAITLVKTTPSLTL